MDNKTWFCGIDPGKDGGIAFISADGKKVKYYGVPRIRNKAVDEPELTKILRLVKKRANHCVIEDVHSVFGSSAKSNFEFGDICGFLRSALVLMGVPFTKVQPKKWQAEMFEGVAMIKKQKRGNKRLSTDTKAMAEIAAKRLFPKEEFLHHQAGSRAYKAHDGVVDAVLLAEYCRRKYS